MYIRNRASGQLLSINEFKAEHPNTCFPQQITDEILDSFGYDPVLNGPGASVSGPYQVSTPDGVENVEGTWFTKFVVGPSFENDTEEDAYKRHIDTKIASGIRSDRNIKLRQSDWTQLADAALSPSDKSDWVQYRQTLRDIPSSAGFPHDVSWPLEPGADLAEVPLDPEAESA